MARIEILPVDGLSRFATFCKLPRLIYAGARGFAPPLDVQRWTLFAHRLNPHYKLVDEQKFLARRGGRWVGRIAAHVYKDGLTPVGASAAQFGALDALDDRDIVAALTGAAESWLSARGATRVNGPFSPSINGECGLLVDGFEATPMFLMPWHPPYLSRHIEALGYEKARDLFSYRFDLAALGERRAPSIASRKEWRNRLKLRPLDFDRLKTHETALMTDLFNDAWSGNWGFVPFTKDEFDEQADGLKFITPPDWGMVVELDGVAQTFMVALPNLHEIAADLDGRLVPFGLPRLIARMRSHKFDSARIALLGTRKALQNSATGGAILMAMIEEMFRRASQASVKHLEVGWVLEDNTPMRRPIEMFGGKIDKVHRIYEKRIGVGSDSPAHLRASAETTSHLEDATS